MPLKINPDQIGFNARGDGVFMLPFAEQIAFFRQKLNLPTEHYDDILQASHDRAFMVAGAAKADLLADLRAAVDKSIADGKSIQWFRKEFDKIVQRNGWEGWTGSDSEKGKAWRTRVIYRTNIMSSYAAGRYQQLTDPDLLKSRPFWKYLHNDTVLHPRPLHKAWGDKPVILRYDDPWWQAHFPPNGWGCRCRVVPVRESEDTGQHAPDNGSYEKVDREGVVHTIPKGIDYGWDYAPGQSNAALLQQVIAKQDGADWRLARDNVRELVNSPVFRSFFNGKLEGEFPIAVLDPAEQQLLGAQAQTILLSRVSIDEHVAKHPEIGVDDYVKVQDIIDRGDIYLQGDSRLIYLLMDGVWYRAALKRTGDGLKNYFLTLFRNDKAQPPKGAIKVR